MIPCSSCFFSSIALFSKYFCEFIHRSRKRAANLVSIRIYHPSCTCIVAFHTMYALCHSSLSYYGDGLWVSGGATIWENNFRIPLHSFLSFFYQPWILYTALRQAQCSSITLSWVSLIMQHWLWGFVTDFPQIYCKVGNISSCFFFSTTAVGK